MAEQVFVARERELGQLQAFLDRALAGQGQVCFVTGEAGAGKTALVTEFARRAQEADADLLAAFGSCNAQTGIGDPYQPFRQVLGMLTGDVEARLAQGAITEENAGRLESFLRLSGQAVVEYGPDLIDIFVPGGALAARVASELARRTGWMDRLDELLQREAEASVGDTVLEQSHIFQQYTNVLQAMAARRPLLLVLDDLQWADVASISLLFHLVRTTSKSRILIVGAYRPEDVALGRAGERHPLEPVLNELKRYRGDVWLELGQAEGTEGREFVDAFLDTQPNRLEEDFRQALLQRTRGHPLFTIELLRAMQERGDLVQDTAERWVEGPTLDWDALPARVEGVIEERIGRLEAQLRETLVVASVEGEEFTAEVLARVQAVDERELVRRLTRELEKQHRLIRELGTRRLNRDRLSLYRFQHNLLQRYLYNNLGEGEQAYLHEDVGNVLEELYGDRADEIAAQLARHFEEAGLEGKARHYLYHAGEQARRQYAYDEAVAYLSRALELTPETDYAARYEILLTREKVYNVQGARDSQAQDLTMLQDLAEALADDQRRTAVALRHANFAYVTDDYPGAIAAAQKAIALARASRDTHGEARGYLLWGSALGHRGEYDAAWSQLEQCLTMARTANVHQIEADSLRALGSVCWNQGDYVRARAYHEQALRIYHEIGDRRGENMTLMDLGIFCNELGDNTAARAYYEQSLRVSREIGDRRGEGMTLNNLGQVCRDFGDYAGAEAYFEQALGISREIGARQGESIMLESLGLLSCHLGDYRAAWEYSKQALRIAQDVGGRREEGYALTNLGHALVGLGRLEEAADAYRQAVELRKELGQHNLAMESLAGLARVSLRLEERAQALAQIEEILSHLEANTLDGTDDPFQVYLTCYHILRASQDPRAGTILDAAHTLLQERASEIDDEDMRRSFLRNVPAHREIIGEWAKSNEVQDS